MKPNGSVGHEVSSCNQKRDPVDCRRVSSLMRGEALESDDGVIDESIGLNLRPIGVETSAPFADREQSGSPH
ncbi:hypothetical protein [Burkholderia seminalis]|uniref:hypothetical protein n=1 Tax=Burkholderia seminalis TaxID=488731 RepID=UPI001F3F59B4|nr:hypothetical protein [Burkholderia seminalis]